MHLRVPLLHRVFRWLVVVAVAAVIFYALILSVPPETIIDTRFEFVPLDKWRHFVVYAAFGFALTVRSVVCPDFASSWCSSTMTPGSLPQFSSGRYQ